jgi:hypothetical protein
MLFEMLTRPTELLNGDPAAYGRELSVAAIDGRLDDILSSFSEESARRYTGVR